MSDNDTTAKKIGQRGNVIFLADRKSRRDKNPEATTDSAIFCELRRPTPKEMSKLVENAEHGGEYSQKDSITDYIDTCSRTELRLLYPGAYSSWKNVKQRCGRGEGVLHPDFKEFPDFLLAMGPRPTPGWSVDRTDHTDPDYSPVKCCWASQPVSDSI